MTIKEKLPHDLISDYDKFSARANDDDFDDFIKALLYLEPPELHISVAEACEMYRQSELQKEALPRDFYAWYRSGAIEGIRRTEKGKLQLLREGVEKNLDYLLKIQGV